MELSIYIGWDSREIPAYDVCTYSIFKRHTDPAVQLRITPLIQRDLRNKGMYTRPLDKKAATEFSLTRFLTPFLNNFKGYAIFVDCDFLFLSDISKVLDLVDPSKAVSVVQHDYRPTESEKMDGAKQFLYPRKNWSSFMVFNCSHPSNRRLSIDTVNSATPQYLHRFSWLNDNEIGALPESWNYLEGWYDGNRSISEIDAIHYTRGGPWFKNNQPVDFEDLWLTEQEALQAKNAKELKSA